MDADPATVKTTALPVPSPAGNVHTTDVSACDTIAHNEPPIETEPPPVEKLVPVSVMETPPAVG